MNRLVKITVMLALAAGLLSFAAPPLVPSQAETTETYIVLYTLQAVPADAAGVIAKAGGTLVYSYGDIGVAIAQSGDASFRGKLLKDERVENASPTSDFGVQVKDKIEASNPVSVQEVSSWGDPLSNRQWDMVQIQVPEAHEITSGSPLVIVGDIDTGLDYTHPDLAANVDLTRSVSCIGGVPNQDPDAWMDDHGHGTHTAGTIAAAENGIGIVGVAPNVKIAGIKAGNAAGYFFPEAVICAFMWAGSHQIDVTNNGYFADPWLFDCQNDPEQHAIWKAEQRAIRYALQQGVTVVAAEGNENVDLADQNLDTISPDSDRRPPSREVTNACVVLPVGIPGVIGVTANGSNREKAYYSNYGLGVTQVVAPGGDYPFQNPADGSLGAVLSTYPGNRYRLAQGASMASPHVAGLAALIISRFGKMPPGRVQALINQSANPLPCPPNPFDPDGTGAFLAECQGADGYNSFYGHGLIDAYRAVTPTP